jgi:hypothetical protein
MSDEFLLANFKAFVPQAKKQKMTGFHMFTYIRHLETERRVRAVNTPASYSGGPGWSNISPEIGYPD